MLKPKTDTDMLHPMLLICIGRIDTLIKKHNAPFVLFETGRIQERHQQLINAGKERRIISPHLYNLKSVPPLYTTAVDYVFKKNKKLSWNLRDATVKAWYELFGNLVLDVCPELEWGGLRRKDSNYNEFLLKKRVLISNHSKWRCVI